MTCIAQNMVIIASLVAALVVVSVAVEHPRDPNILLTVRLLLYEGLRTRVVQPL